MKFKVGDKVIPISKYGQDLNCSVVWRGSDKKFLYINTIREDGTFICSNTKIDFESGDFFREEDLIPYKNKKRKISELEEITNKQAKEIKGLKLIAAKLHESSNLVKEGLVKSNNELRADVIDNAKSFVQHYENENWEFVISEKLHRVVAFNLKLKYNHFGFHQDDLRVFNEHIWKAIALGRALNLDVSEFENCVQPDEVVVGQEIEVLNLKGEKTGLFRTVQKIKEDGLPVYGGIFCSKFKITKDTKAIYNEVK